MNQKRPIVERGAQGLRVLLCCLTAWPLLDTLALAEGNAYEQTVLVANNEDYHPIAFVDRYLINPWGIALRPPGAGGHIWVSNAGNASTSLYIGDANGKPLYQDGLKVLAIDGPKISFEDGLPNVTGQVYKHPSPWTSNSSATASTP